MGFTCKTISWLLAVCHFQSKGKKQSVCLLLLFVVELQTWMFLLSCLSHVTFLGSRVGSLHSLWLAPSLTWIKVSSLQLQPWTSLPSSLHWYNNLLDYILMCSMFCCLSSSLYYIWHLLHFNWNAIMNFFPFQTLNIYNKNVTYNTIIYNTNTYCNRAVQNDVCTDCFNTHLQTVRNVHGTWQIYYRKVTKNRQWKYH